VVNPIQKNYPHMDLNVPEHLPIFSLLGKFSCDEILLKLLVMTRRSWRWVILFHHNNGLEP